MPPSISNDLYRREREDRERDIIRIFNPLDTEFVYKYDGRSWRVPAKTSKDEPRYLAEKFSHDICNYIIDQRIINKGERIIDDMRAKGGNNIDLEDPYFLNVKIWDKIDQGATRDQMRAEIIPIVILGEVSRYGEDIPERETQQMRKLGVSIEQELFSDATKRKIEELRPASPTIGAISPITEPKRAPGRPARVSAEEVTNEW